MKQKKTTYTLEKELMTSAFQKRMYDDKPLDPDSFSDNEYNIIGLKKFDSTSNITMERSTGSKIRSIGAYSIAGFIGFVFAILISVCVYRIVVLDAEPISLIEFLDYFETIDIIPTDSITEWFNNVNSNIAEWGSVSGVLGVLGDIAQAVMNFFRVIAMILSGLYYMILFVVYILRLTLW